MPSDSTLGPVSSPAVRAAERPDDVFSALEDIARRSLGIRRPITRNDTLVGGLELDSLGLLSFVVEVENRFRITLGEEEQELKTVGDLCDLIERRIAEVCS